jgi:hypothetical protein
LFDPEFDPDPDPDPDPEDEVGWGLLVEDSTPLSVLKLAL